MRTQTQRMTTRRARLYIRLAARIQARGVTPTPKLAENVRQAQSLLGRVK